MESQVIRISDLAVTSDVVQGHRFRNCVIFGPAVLAPLSDTAINECQFEGGPENWFIEVQPPQRLAGIIALVDCSFVRCTFVRIGFVGDAALRELFANSLTARPDVSSDE